MTLRLLAIFVVLAWMAPSPAVVAEEAPHPALYIGVLRTGMTLPQVRNVLAATQVVTGVEETGNRDGSPRMINATIQGEATVVFFSSATKGSKVYRIVVSQDLGTNTVVGILSGWTKRFGKPSAIYCENGKRTCRVGWGLRPGSEGTLARIGPDPLRLLGEVDASEKTVSLTLIDDDLAD